MPQEITDVPAELFLHYKHIKIYCTYKNNYIISGAFPYHYVLDEFGVLDDSFDVREIKGWVNTSPHSNTSDTEYIKNFLIKCINDGRFKEHIKVERSPWEYSSLCYGGDL